MSDAHRSHEGERTEGESQGAERSFGDRGRGVVITGPRRTATPPDGWQWWAERLPGAKVVPRHGKNLRQIAEENDAWAVLVIQHERVTVYLPDEGIEYFYHPGMAKPRLKSIWRGQGDPMVTAMDLGEGDEVLDCTLGRATDAIIASYIVGPSGRVVGIESVPLIAALTEHGLKTFEFSQGRPEENEAIREAMARIEVVCADHLDYLRQAEPKSFDVVYFDPLFHRPVQESTAMIPLRALADKVPLRREAFERAKEVARRCVVVKQRRETPLWEQFPPDRVVTGRHSHIEYGVFYCDQRRPQG